MPRSPQASVTTGWQWQKWEMTYDDTHEWSTHYRHAEHGTWDFNPGNPNPEFKVLSTSSSWQF